MVQWIGKAINTFQYDNIVGLPKVPVCSNFNCTLYRIVDGINETKMR